jgi:hypothetical protein
MDTERANGHTQLLIARIAEYEVLYAGSFARGARPSPAASFEMKKLEDEIQGELVVSRAIAEAAGVPTLKPSLTSLSEVHGHHWQKARRALVELSAVLSKQAEIEVIVGPVGPQLSARSLHPLIWSTAWRLWDDGHHRQAVQTAAAALESHLQAIVGRGDVAGQDLATAFSINDPDDSWPRFRFRDIDRSTNERGWKSAHEGAASLTRGAFMFVRNLTSHTGMTFDDAEYLEQLAVLSTVARMVDRCDVMM